MNKFVFFGPEKGICVSLISHTNQSLRSRRLALPGNMGPPGLDYMRTKMEGRGIGCECCYWCIICTVILTCVCVFSFIHILMLKCVSVVYCMCVRFPAPLMLVNGEPVGRGQFLKYRHQPASRCFQSCQQVAPIPPLTTCMAKQHIARLDISQEIFKVG